MFFHRIGHNRKKGADIESVEKSLKLAFNGEINTDLILRRVSSHDGDLFLAAFINGMADEVKIDEFAVKPIMESDTRGMSLEEIITDAVQIGETKIETDMDAVIEMIADGMTALFCGGRRGAV